MMNSAKKPQHKEARQSILARLRDEYSDGLLGIKEAAAEVRKTELATRRAFGRNSPGYPPAQKDPISGQWGVELQDMATWLYQNQGTARFAKKRVPFLEIKVTEPICLTWRAVFLEDGRVLYGPLRPSLQGSTR